MSSRTQISNVSANVSRRVKSRISGKAVRKPWRKNKAGRVPRKAVKLAPAFTREHFDDETIWFFANGQTISVPVLDPNDFVREGAMIDDDRAVSLENWTHLHDKNLLPTPAQRAQGARNLDRLRLELLATTEGGQLHFLNPEVMVKKDLNGTGGYLMRTNGADGEEVILPDGFASVDPSPPIDASGSPLIRTTVLNHRKKFVEASKYVNFGGFETLGAHTGSRDFVRKDAEAKSLAPASMIATRDVEEILGESAIAVHEKPSDQQHPSNEVISTTMPPWDLFDSDFFEDEDEEIIRLEHERIEEATLSQAPEDVTDADGDIEMIDYVEPEAELEVEYYGEPETVVIPEEAQINELLQFDWYHAHLRAREAGLVRPDTATTPAEANYIIGSSQGPTTELLMFARDMDDDQYSTTKAIGARQDNGAVIMGNVTHDSMRRYVLLLNGAGHVRECFDLYETFNLWPNNIHGEPLAGSKAPWVPACMAKLLKPNLSFRLSYPQGTRGRDKNEALDEDLYRESSKVRNFSKMRDIWTYEGGRIVEETWSEDNLSWWKSDEDRRRFPRFQFSVIGVTPDDPPKVEDVPKLTEVNIEKMPVRAFGYSGGAKLPTKYHFGEFPVLSLDKSAVEPELNVDEKVEEEVNDEVDIEVGFSLQESLNEESTFIDDDEWLADAEAGITEAPVEAARDSSPFQEIPDEVVQSSAPSQFQIGTIESEFRKSDNSPCQEKDLDSGIVSNGEDSHVEETLLLETHSSIVSNVKDFHIEETLPLETHSGIVPNVEGSHIEETLPLETNKDQILGVSSRHLFISGTPKGYSDDLDVQDARPTFNSEVGQAVWESHLVFEEPISANMVKNFGHKRILSDLSAHTESTEEDSSKSSPPSSDDGREILQDIDLNRERKSMEEKGNNKDLVESAYFLLEAMTTPLPATQFDADLIDEVLQVKETPMKGQITTIQSPIEPGVIAMCTAWMMADPASFFTMAGIGLCAWAGQEVLRKI